MSTPDRPQIIIEADLYGVQHVRIRVRDAAQRAEGLGLLREALPSIGEVDRACRAFALRDVPGDERPR
jgi:hypothetical protein